MFRLRLTPYYLICIFVTLIFLTSPSEAQDAAYYATQNDAVTATSLISQVNSWRVTEGLAPLKANDTLQQMAIDQAAFVRAQLRAGFTVSDYHVDALGRHPQQRAYSQYHWTTYGTSAQIEIGENAAIGNIRYAINYWQNSDLHRRAALSQIFREAGAAAIPMPGGDTLFIIVFGARPGVLTAQVDAAHTTLYLSKENSRYSNARLQDPSIRVFSSDGDAITPVQPWRVSMRVPVSSFTKLFILFTSGDTQSIIEIDTTTDVAILPQTVVDVLVATASAPTQTPTTVPTQSPFTTSTPTLIPTQTQIPTQTLPPTWTPPPTVTPMPTIVPTEIANPDLIITYDRNALILRSVSANRLNLTTLRLVGSIGDISVERWLRVAPFPADAFAPNQCLVAYRPGASVPQPSECSFVRSAVQMGTERIFWAAPFTVELNGQVIATCSSSLPRCLVKVQ